MAGTLEFEINGIKYRARPMDARRQFHVTRRLTGLAGAVAPLAALGGEGKEGALMDALPAALGALGNVLASMPDDDADYILNTCLALTDRAIEGDRGWSPVMSSEGVFMFEDMANSLSALIQIVIPILRRDLTGFFSEAPKGGWAALATGKPA